VQAGYGAAKLAKKRGADAVAESGRPSTATNAEQLLVELRERFAQFGLSLHPEKTRLIEFGRRAMQDRKARGKGNLETFNFLGFTHCCGNTSGRRFTVIRKTMRQRMLKKLKAVNLELQQRRHQPVPEQGRYIDALVRGHVNYYGVPFNSRAIGAFRAMVIRLWYKWLNRRSQRPSVTWDRMQRFIARWVPPAIICHPYPSVRFGG
jgi:RNA-directed DNA polymerase